MHTLLAAKDIDISIWSSLTFQDFSDFRGTFQTSEQSEVGKSGKSEKYSRRPQKNSHEMPRRIVLDGKAGKMDINVIFSSPFCATFWDTKMISFG